MVNYNLARELKEAGLTWKPRIGDLYYRKIDQALMRVGYLDSFQDFRDDTWKPSLATLLAELESKGWYWDLEHREFTPNYKCEIFHPEWYIPPFYASSAEEAVAKALIAIYHNFE